MAEKLTRKWISFFQHAGIEDHALAARYAAIFVDNEIRSSMLMELDMELLRVMGISKVGHVLGILKHAKHVRDTELFAAAQPSPTSRSQSDSGTSSPVIEADIAKTSAKKNRSTATSRIIEHYVKQPENNVVSPSRMPTVPTVRVGTSTKRSRVKVTDRLGSTAVNVGSQSRLAAPTSRLTSSSQNTKFNITNVFETEPPPNPPSSRVKRVGTQPKITDRLGTKPVAVSPKRKLEISIQPEAISEEVPTVKRVRRVLPEHEGGYRISMPSGSTPRSREILAKMTASKSITVFDRLGDAAVSSTTEAEEPVITITGFGMQIVKSGNSVFSRLGGKREASPAPQKPAVQGVKARLGHQVPYKPSLTDESSMKADARFKSETTATSSSYATKVAHSDADKEVQYVGVLKTTPMSKKIANVQSRLGTKPKAVKAGPMISTVAKRNSSAGILGNPTNNTKLSAKDRLDLSARNSSNTTRPTKTRKFIMTNKKTGVKTIVYKMTDDDEPPHF